MKTLYAQESKIQNQGYGNSRHVTPELMMIMHAGQVPLLHPTFHIT
jgi:hypothetical protein